jgi:hypothetical protein
MSNKTDETAAKKREFSDRGVLRAFFGMAVTSIWELFSTGMWWVNGETALMPPFLAKFVQDIKGLTDSNCQCSVCRERRASHGVGRETFISAVEKLLPQLLPLWRMEVSDLSLCSQGENAAFMGMLAKELSEKFMAGAQVLGPLLQFAGLEDQVTAMNYLSDLFMEEWAWAKENGLEEPKPEDTVPPPTTSDEEVPTGDESGETDTESSSDSGGNHEG